MTSAAFYYNVAIQVIFFLVLIVCAVTEVRENKIYNIVTYPAILLGLGLNFLRAGTVGAQFSLLGAGVGFMVYLLFYLMKGLGPGDVKLGAAIGAMKGTHFTIEMILWSAVFGFVMAIFALGIVGAVTLFKGAAREVRAMRVPQGAASGEAPKEPERKMPLIPYGAAICLGAAVTFVCELKEVNVHWVN